MENYCGKDSWLIENNGDVNGTLRTRTKHIKDTNQFSKPLSSLKYQQVNLLKLKWLKRQQALHKL